MGIFDDVVVNAKSAAEAVGRKAGQLVDVSKLRIGAAEVNAEITKRYETLGQYVYENCRELTAADPEAVGKMAEIDELKAQATAIAKELNGVSRPTVENYIQYLESANLIYQSWPVDMAGKRVLKARPKIYIADAAIRNAVLMDDSLLTDPVEMGKIVETAVYKHVAAFYYQQAASVGYYRGGRKNKEIDIVVEYPNTGNILIEVKYREGAPIPDDDAIAELCGEASAAIVVTKTASDFGVHHTKSGKDMLRIPAFAFLYLLGHAEKHGYRGIE